ncbi:MAG TPA: 1-phosphofructokinase [Clostridia bacterium]|nr:1-phosphofructokinase [Clostridia bacterium]
MITTVTLNPSIDKTITIEGFTYGGMNRIIGSRIDPSGKGINVAIAYSQLGGQALCTGINYRENGNLIEQRLDRDDIAHDFVMADGEVRINHKVYDRSTKAVTELNESGHMVTDEVLAELKNKLVAHCLRSDILVLSGSAPKGVPTGIYKDLLGSVSDLSVKTILDAEGDLLLHGLKGSPDLIKPNLFELETALKIKITSHGDIVKAAQVFLDKGVKVIGVSLGAEGAVIVNESHAYYAPALKVDVKGTTGAGDSVIAGFCLAIKEGLDLKEMLRYGVAAATASVIREGTLMCTRRDFESLLPKVQVNRL